MGWQWHQLDHMHIICTLLQTDNHSSTSSLIFLQAGCSSWCSTNSVKALKTLLSIINCDIIMAALHSRCWHYTFALWFLLVLSFFPCLLSAVPDWMLPYFHTWCCLSANLGCRSEMCCMWLDENTGCKKSPKICHLHIIAHFCRAISSQLRHISTIGKKLVKQQYCIYLLHKSPQYGELRPTNGWDRFSSLGHPNKFQRVSRLAFVTAATLLTRGQPNFARWLAISWVGILYIHFRGLWPRRNFTKMTGAKFTLHPKSCILLYWQC